MAPDRFQVQNDEPVLRASLRESLGIGMQSADVVGGESGKGSDGQQREQGARK